MRWLYSRRRREAELEEEIRGHLEMAAQDHTARGESPEEAAYAARREFGNATLVKEITRTMWGGAWLDQLLQDLRLAARSLRRSPGFLVVAVLALGLGLGLSTTMFAVIDAAMHPRQVYANADRLFLLNARMGSRAGKIVTQGELLRLIRERVPSLDAVVPIAVSSEPIRLGADERDQFELTVPARFFEVVGLRPEVGRAFVPADGQNVALVSHEVWRAALGGRRDLAGAHVTIGDRSYAVLGVLPQGTHSAGAYLQLLPADEQANATPDALPRAPLLRLRAGASEADAARDLKALASLLTSTYASPAAPFGLSLWNWLDGQNLRDETRGIHLMMVVSALAVLLIACVNLAHLMLARGLAKRRELAMRMALGAGRAGIVRVILTESALIGAGGVALGALLAVWGAKVLDSMIPFDVGSLGFVQTQLSWRVFALGALAAVISGVVFGLVPALRVAFSVRITEPLKDEGGTTTGGKRWRHSPLVIIEVALALVLLMGGTLLLRTVHRMRTATTAFNPETLVNAGAGGRRPPAGRPGSAQDTTGLLDLGQVLATVRGVPGVVDAALVGGGRASGAAVTAEMAADSTRVITTQSYPIVSPNYLRVHGLSILRGRDFEPGDASSDGVAILSEAAAARLYPKGEAVGRMLKLGGPATKAPWVRIVGVARTPLASWTRTGFVGSAGTGEESAPLWVARHWGKAPFGSLLVRTMSRAPVC